MGGERGCVPLSAELVEQRRRPLDVGEYEGDRSSRKFGPHDEIIRRWQRLSKTCASSDTPARWRTSGCYPPREQEMLSQR